VAGAADTGALVDVLIGVGVDVGIGVLVGGALGVLGHDAGGTLTSVLYVRLHGDGCCLSQSATG
jgi:hypothetical protein